MHVWYMLTPKQPRTHELRDPGRQLMARTIQEYKAHYADELNEATLVHQLNGAKSHLDWPGETHRDLVGQGMGISNDPCGLWHVERYLARWLTFYVEMHPDFDHDTMFDLPSPVHTGDNRFIDQELLR
jgi:hypothetical protein